MTETEYNLFEQLMVVDDQQAKRIAELEARLEELENKNIPLYYPTPPPGQVHKEGTNPTFKSAPPVCNQCGMEFNGTTGYVCTNMNCPMGCGPIIC
ncbi:MAG: hypothetical protein HOK52_04810 [Candidatus Marinimicrobia bacterium]|jgi:hypothetical protein|nr:hypothetical protein [Candidatus Neomarinimicrobiota bacterium]